MSSTSKAGIPVRLHLFANGVEYIVNTSGMAWTTIRQDSNTVPSVWFNANFTNGVTVSYYAEVDPNHIYPEINESNNRYPSSGTQSVTFQKRRTFDVIGWRMRYHPSGFTGNQYAGGWEISVPNKAPLATSPSDGTLVPEGGLVVLNGDATDLEDGALADGSLRWSSDKDGVLGTGGSLALNTLSAGPHTITLRATDSNAAFTEESVHIIVGVPLTVDVQPDTISSGGPPPDVTVIITLPPGYPTDDIDTGTLRLLIGNTELEPTDTAQLGDTDNDGLPELKLTFDGAAVQAALPDGPGSAEATLSGQLDGGMQVQGSDIIGLTLAGDADCSGVVNAVDSLQVLRFVAGLGQANCLSAADVDCNFVINSVDSLKILRFVAGLPQTGLPPDCPGIAPAALSISTAFGDGGGLPGPAWLGALLAVPALVAVRRRRLL